MGDKFNTWARQFVVADEPSQRSDIASAAAAEIEIAPNRRAAVGQWVASINTYVSNDESASDDYIARGKAYDFLADTLKCLKTDTLRADQIKLLASFFCNLFSSDHRGGVSGAADALNHLFAMKFFQHTLSYDILQSIAKLGDDFQRQLPATRLKLYKLFLGFLKNPDVCSDLEYRDGATCGSFVKLFEICWNERDPQNLMLWFETLTVFMQNFSPSPEVTAEVFKFSSAYFPISMRASSTPTGVTAADLKQALRSSFASHHRLSSHTIPFLVNKLDQAEAVTVAVKVDILQTLEACLREYGNPKQSVVPHAESIWNSLKYEVRNGEINDAIEGTLKAIGALTKRLDDEDLKAFFATAWLDLSDDLTAPRYSNSAGKLLIAIAGASSPAFALVSSKALPLAQGTIRQSKSTSHQQDLLTLIYSLLLVRSHRHKEDSRDQSFAHKLNDESFDDSLFSSTFEPLWHEVQSDEKNTIEQIGLLRKLMEGMSALVDQQSSGPVPQRLCKDTTCQQIFQWLAELAVIYPLGGRSISGKNGTEASKGLRESAVSSLKTALPRYPEGFQQLLVQYLSSVQGAWNDSTSSVDLVAESRLVATALCEIGCSGATDLTLSNSIILLRFLMQSLRWIMSRKANPRYWTAFITSIHVVILQSLETLKGSVDERSSNLTITEDWYALCSHDLEDDGAPAVEAGMGHSLASNEVIANGASGYQSFLAYSVGVVRQLYRRFVSPHERSGHVGGPQWAVGTSPDMSGDDRILMDQQDIVLHHLGALATSVVRALSIEEQKALHLDEEVFLLFRGDAQTSDQTLFRDEVLKSSIVEISQVQAYRTAPLSMGILQGLYPEAISYEYHISAMESLCHTLTSAPSPCSDSTRAALDAIFATLSNKFTVKGEERKQKRAEMQQIMVHKFEGIWKAGGGGDGGDDQAEGCVVEDSTAIRIFRSILHLLAGDIARFQGNPSENALLQLVCAEAPGQKSALASPSPSSTIGRQLAQSFEVLVSPKECLEPSNHAILKRLAPQWIYNQTVSPFLASCFPLGDSSTSEEEKEEKEQSMVSRAVASLAVVKHLRYEHYASDVDQILRVCIRSLSTFTVGPEMESCLRVLHTILDTGKDRETVKGHVRSLVLGVGNVYKTALEQARSRKVGHSEHACRQLALSFLSKIPSGIVGEGGSGSGVINAHRHLAPHGRVVVAIATLACGDPVREIRRAAPMLRTTWEAAMA